MLGTLGTSIIGLLIGLVAAGAGLLLVLGLGAVLLVGAVYALFGLGWFETARVSGLYDLDVPLPALRRSGRPGFPGWLRSLLLQLGDGAMWRALASFALSSLLGLLLVPLVRVVVIGVALLFAPFGSASSHRFLGVEVSAGAAPLLGIAAVLLSLAAALALLLLHRTLSVAIIASAPTEAKLAAEARRSADRAKQSAEQREGAVRAADVERTRIERDLHDGVQPRLVSVGMTLGLAQQKIDEDPAAAKSLIAEAHTSTKAAITELRQLARGIHASVLEDRGIDAALSALVARSPIPVQLDVRLPEHGADATAGIAGEAGGAVRDAETAVYFCVAEALTNAAKHSRASACRVLVRRRGGTADGAAADGAAADGTGSAADAAAPTTPADAADAADAAEATLWARIEDDGIGGSRVVPGGGLDGLVNRVRAAGGTIRIDSPQGGPTAVEVSIPCAS